MAAAWTYVSTTTTYSSGNGTLVVDLPTYSVNDAVIVTIVAGWSTITQPSGWFGADTGLSGAGSIATYWKSMAGSEGTTLSITTTGGNIYFCATASCYTGGIPTAQVMGAAANPELTNSQTTTAHTITGGDGVNNLHYVAFASSGTGYNNLNFGDTTANNYTERASQADAASSTKIECGDRNLSNTTVPSLAPDTTTTFGGSSQLVLGFVAVAAAGDAWGWAN